MRHKTEPTRAIDAHVGKQLRLMRAARGLSQEAIANKLGISYQQLHKYETGTNSLAASRLYDLSQLLGVRPDAFFEGLEQASAHDAAGANEDILISREQVQLLKYLNAVPVYQRAAVADLLRSISALDAVRQ